MKNTFALIMALLLAQAACALSVQVTVYNTNCFTGMGYAVAMASGGQPPYTYTWSTGASGPESDALPSGQYSVSVTDNAGGIGSVNFQVYTASTPDLVGNIFFPPLEPCQDQCNGGFRLYLMNVPQGYTINTTPQMTVQAYIPPVQEQVVSMTMYEFVGACPGQQVQLQVTNGCGAPALTSVTIPAALPDPTVAFTQIVGSCASSNNGFVAGTAISAGQGQLSLWNMQAVDGLGAAIPTTPMSIASFGVPFQLTGLHPGEWTLRFTSQENIGSVQSPCVVEFPFTITDLGSDCGAVAGRVYADAIVNCVQNGGEPNLPGMVVVAQPGNHHTLTNAVGEYNMTLPHGTYTITSSSANYAENCGSATTPFTLGSAQPNAVRNIGLTGLLGLDMRLSVASGAARPGFPLSMNVRFNNESAVLAGNGTVSLTFDPILSYVSASPAPASVNGNTLTWNSASIGALQERLFNISFQVPPDVGLLGTVLSSTATGNVSNPETNLANNTYTHLVMVTGAYDPNDKTALTSSRESNEIYFITGDDWIDYTIRFQNTGTDTAFNVFITDTLPATLDPSTFQRGAASHSNSVSLTGQGVLRWNFLNIQLPDSNVNEPRSHGFVSFRIRPKQPVLPGTIIENIANIYFDFNPPVITEPSVLVATIGTSATNGDAAHFSVHPNPTEGQCVVRFANGTGLQGHLWVRSMDGRVMADASMIAGPEITLDMRHLASGTYLLEFQGSNPFRSTLRLVKF